MLNEVFQSGNWLPYTFAFLIGLSMLLYAILDGYDLGVGILSRFVDDKNRDRMISSIAPFWDANETWLVLGAGLILVAFPQAHGIIFGHFYLPIALMLIALIFRGVSFDFRKKTPPETKPFWDGAFFWSSLITALTQGYMLGRFITGMSEQVSAYLFAIFFMGLVTLGYTLMGATWTVYKGEGELHLRAIRWARRALWAMVISASLSTVMAVLIDTRIYEKMFSFPEIIVLIIMPVASAVLTILMDAVLRALPKMNDQLSWTPFFISIIIFALGFTGLAYSFYPYIIPGTLKIVDAAAADKSLLVILIGTAIVLPVQIFYTFFAYRVFRGKATDLSYD